VRAALAVVLAGVVLAFAGLYNTVWGYDLVEPAVGVLLLVVFAVRSLMLPTGRPGGET
jgi:hypothetical protein